jgi:hypothetical protein
LGDVDEEEDYESLRQALREHVPLRLLCPRVSAMLLGGGGDEAGGGEEKSVSLFD